MTNNKFNSYLKYEQLCTTLKSYADNYPSLIKLQSIGKSFEGRDIWLASVTCFASGPDHEKPALWVDGNIHSAELVSSMAALKLIDTLTNGYGTDPTITRTLDSRCFYIVPRVNPDGAEWALSDTPRLTRSSVRPWPYVEQASDGLQIEDIDGDGRILSMRIPDPNGPWKISPEDNRLMERRDPTEIDGNFYRIIPEGTINSYKINDIHLQTQKEGLDLNRNFPSRWRGEHDQKGAGAFPGSEPEVRCLLDFISQHRNICSAISLHSYSGALLRPFSFQADDTMPTEDLWVYKKIGDKGSALTGYPNVSAYDEFRYHPQQIITGAMDDWMYEENGCFAWTVELWSPQTQAGISEYKLIDWYREHSLADEQKMLLWSDEQLHGKGYIDWYTYDHPELGTVELGGWDPLFSFWNPPTEKLDAEISRLPGWLIWHALISPRLEILKTACCAVGSNLWQIDITVQNTGWLATDISRLARNKQLIRGIIIDIDIPAHVQIIQGEQRTLLGQLEGRALKPSTPTGWAGGTSDVTDDRINYRWVVAAAAGTEIKITASHERAGTVRSTLALQE